MTPQRILLPVDVTHCPIDVFDVVNDFARRPGVTVILLHVLKLNIVAPVNRIYEELGQEAQWYLERLAEEKIHPFASTVTHVRRGRVAEQILAEAWEEKVDLIILPADRPSFWDRLKAVWQALSGSVTCPLAEKHIRQAPCSVMVVPSKRTLNCENAWGRPVIGECLPEVMAR